MRLGTILEQMHPSIRDITELFHRSHLTEQMHR